MSEETELLRLILREPETGLEEAMRRYAPFVKAAAGRVLPGAPQEVEECMADTFIALWKNAGTLLDRQIPPKAWLAVTARNKALNRLRALRRQNALPLDETFAAGLDEAGPLAEGPAVTLREIYCDGLYLRLALTLEDTDGSLAGYDQVTTEQRVLESPDELADASLLIDGEYAGAPFTAPLFQRVDETTFAAELIYPLREPIAGTHEASVTLFTLGVGGSWGENGYTQYDLPGGDRTLTFSFTADSSANRSWTGPVEQNGYTLEAIVATPGETCVMLRLPEGAEPPSVLVEAEGTPLEMARGQRMEAGVWRYDFDAAPASAVEWTVTAADKNNGNATLARFAVEIAQETSQDF